MLHLWLPYFVIPSSLSGDGVGKAELREQRDGCVAVIAWGAALTGIPTVAILVCAGHEFAGEAVVVTGVALIGFGLIEVTDRIKEWKMRA